MQVVARVIRLEELERVGRIARRRVEVDHGVELAAAPDERVHRGALRLERCREGRARAGRRERRADDDDATVVRPDDELAIASNDVLGRHAVHPAPRDVVDPFQQDHVRQARRHEHVAIEPGQGARAGSIGEDAAARDPRVHHGLHWFPAVEQPLGQDVRPPCVRIPRRERAVGDGVADRRDDAGGGAVGDVHADEERPNVDAGVGRELARARRIAPAHVVRLKCKRVSRRQPRRIGEVEADGEVAQRRHGSRHGITEDHCARTQPDGRQAAEGQHAIGGHIDRCAHAANGDVGCADDERPVAVLVRQPNPDAIATDRGADDEPDGLVEERRGAVDGIAWWPGRRVGRTRGPRGEPAARGGLRTLRLWPGAGAGEDKCGTRADAKHWDRPFRGRDLSRVPDLIAPTGFPSVAHPGRHGCGCLT